MKSIQVKVEEKFQGEFEELKKTTGISLLRLYQQALRYGLETLKSIHKS